MSLKNSLLDILKIGDLKDKVFQFLEAKFELKKLEIQEKAEGGIAKLIYAIVLLILSSIVLVFLLILASYLLNIWLGEPNGTLIISGVLALALALFIGYKKKIILKIRKVIERELDAY